MRLARRLRADGAIGGLAKSVRALIDVTARTVRATDELARLAAEHGRMLITINAAILDARMRMTVAALLPARRARGDFVRREDGARIEGAFVAMGVADESAR